MAACVASPSGVGGVEDHEYRDGDGGDDEEQFDPEGHWRRGSLGVGEGMGVEEIDLEKAWLADVADVDVGRDGWGLVVSVENGREKVKRSTFLEDQASRGMMI